MQSTCKLAIAIIAGTAISSAAYAQRQTVPQKPGNPHRHQPVKCAAGQRILPDEVASVRVLPDGHVEMISGWVKYIPPVIDTPDAEVFDGFGNDGTHASNGGGPPVDWCTFGCSQGGYCPAYTGGYRLYGGTTYINPDTAHGFTCGAGNNGALCAGCDLGWYWTVTEDAYILISIYENWNDASTTDKGYTGFVSGIILHYTNLPASTGGYYYSNIDLTSSGLNWTMPADGDGALFSALGRLYDTNTNTFVLEPSPGTQFMLFGPNNTAAHPGLFSAHGWDDDGGTAGNTPPGAGDGTWEAGENYSYDLGAQGFCPQYWGNMIGFRKVVAATGACCVGGASAGCQVLTAAACTTAGGSYNGDASTCAPANTPGQYTCCYPNCNGSTGANCVNVNDFTCFLTQYALSAPTCVGCYANCNGSTGANNVNVNDFTCFLGSYALGCSSC